MTVDHDKEAKSLLLLHEEDVDLSEILNNFPNTVGAPYLAIRQTNAF